MPNPKYQPPPPIYSLFCYDWDAIAHQQLNQLQPVVHSGFDLFSFPSNARLAWFDMKRFTRLCEWRAKLFGYRYVVSHHEQFGALAAALLAERMGWPGTPVQAVLACQHKFYMRQVLQRICPEVNPRFELLNAAYGEDIPHGLKYPLFIKPTKAAFSVLARGVRNRDELQAHTRFGKWELWVIRHLVEPFERIMKERLPGVPTAHSMIIEEPVAGTQYCFDGYVYQGEFRPLGFVDVVMYPGTQAFMRFDFPSKLSLTLQQRAQDVARRFLAEIGFTHGMFNMEFFYDAASDKLTVIEFNPRLASQFSDLYRRVCGNNLHEMALHLAMGIDPGPVHWDRAGQRAASSLVYRNFDPKRLPHYPDKVQREVFAKGYPDALLLEFRKDQGSIERDYKWLGSYRYGIMHLGGEDAEDLRRRAEVASSLLGWTAPYADLYQRGSRADLYSRLSAYTDTLESES